jgi:hypothetical protein
MSDIWKLPKVERAIEEEKIHYLEEVIKENTQKIAMLKNWLKDCEFSLSVHQTCLDKLRREYNINNENINT